MAKDLILELTGNEDIVLEEDRRSDIELVNDLPYYNPGTQDYEELENKPQINGVTLIGNKILEELFPDGIIIEGGYSTGFTPPEALNHEGV